MQGHIVFEHLILLTVATLLGNATYPKRGGFGSFPAEQDLLALFPVGSVSHVQGHFSCVEI